MSKNLTRKGLALGAVVALGSTLFAGTSAFAAGEINVAPSAGTSYNAVAGTVFNLATTTAPGYTASDYRQLKYIVTTDANSAIHYGVGTSSVSSPSSTQLVSVTSSAIGGGVTAANQVSYLGLSADTASVTSSVQVTAFVDANNNGALDAGEWNTVRTVTFKKLADITPVVTIAQPYQADTSVSATVAWGDLNTQQAGVGVATGSTNSGLTTEFKINGTGSYATGTYDSTTGKFTLSHTFASTDTVSAEAAWGTNTFTTPSTNVYSSTALGSAASASTVARTVTHFDAALVAGNDATSAGAVRTNGSYVAKVTATDNASTPAPVAGVAVVGSISAHSFTTDLRPADSTHTEISVTVNGTKYTTTASLVAASWALTTDASGVAQLAISSVGLSAGDSIRADFKAQNFDAYAVGTQTAATYAVSDDNASIVVATSKNTAATLNYSVKDQFGVLSAATNQRLVVTATNAVTGTQYVPVVAGKATITVTPATDSTASMSVSSVLQASTTVDSTGTTWGTTGLTDTVTNTVQIRSAAYSFTTAPAIDATHGINYGAWTAAGAQKQALTTVDQSDSTLTSGLVAPASSTAGGAVWALVTLTGSNAGEKLTASGTGVFLSIDGATPTKGSASKIAQGTSVNVFVASNTTGAKTITITNGTVSATVVVTFDKSVAVTSSVANAGAVVALGSLATSSQAGRSVDVSATIVDKFGNPLQGATVTLSSTGVGYLANTTTTSDANGKVTGKLIVGALENGDAVVTASAALGDSTTASAAKTITFGATDAQIDIVGNRVTATASYTSGKTVAFYVDGIKKWSKLSAADSDLVVNYNLKKGTHTVTVKISGGFATTEKFIVK